MSKLPDSSDWWTRNPSGTAKKIARYSSPGARSRYGVRPRWRCRKPKLLARDQVLPLRDVLLVVERVGVEVVRAVEHLLRREDQRVLRDRRILLQQHFLRADDGTDVVHVVLDLR